jgi:hypothetical protein
VSCSPAALARCAAFLRPTDACAARRLPLPVCATCRPVACRGDAVAVMGALLACAM